MWIVRKKKQSSNSIPIGRTQTSFFLFLIVSVLVLAVLILLPYLASLFFALILSIVFSPVHRYLEKSMGRGKSAAAFVSTILVMLLIVLPLVVFGILLFNEVHNFYNSGSLGQIGNSGIFKSINDQVNTFLHRFSPEVSFDIKSIAERVVGWFVDNLSSFFSKFFEAIVGLFISAIGLFYLFKDGSKAMKQIMFLSPLSDTYDEEIFDKISSAINSVVRGSLVISLIQGFLTGIGFLIFGVPNPILWASIAMVTSLIPSVGTAVIIVPSVIYLYVTGHAPSAVGMLIWGVVAVGLIDNLLSPYLLQRGIKIHPFLILLSVIGGISFFGPIGFMAGPVILSLLFVLLEIYPSIFRASTQRNHT